MKKVFQSVNFILLFSVIILSCKKDNKENITSNEIKIDQSKIQKVPTTEQEKLLVKNLSKVTDVFKEFYKSNDNLKLVNAAIFSKIYTDESILLKDLIYPQNSRLSNNQIFKNYCQKFNVSLNTFSNAFWNVANSTSDNEFSQFLVNLNSSSTQRTENENNNGDQVSIYFPYSEEFAPTTDVNSTYYAPITSIATATADSDEGIGQQPVYINGVFQNYNQVLENDQFAEENPTHIIGVNGIDPVNNQTAVNEAFPPGPPIDLPNLPREVKQVYIGNVKCIKQYDRLISFTGNGGDSEIRFTRSDAFLKFIDGQVQPDFFTVGDKTLCRRDISEKLWYNFANEWDGDWEETNLQQNLAIYEEDNRNETTVGGNLSTTVALAAPPATITGVRSVNFSIKFKSDDALIKQTNYNRDVFFILNRTDLEGEWKVGWPVRDRTANVSFTLNDRTYY